MKITKAILPVAGYGTRFLPATKAMPKEMLPVVDKPIIQYLVEEAVASGICDIIFVTGRGKRAIEEHFDVSHELEQTLANRQKKELLRLVAPLSKLARFTYVRQPAPLGNGDAILRAKHLIAPNEPFAVLFGDDLVDSSIPALKQLIYAFNRYNHPVFALSDVSKLELSHYGTISGQEIEKNVWEVENIIEKPSLRAIKNIKVKHFAIIGKYVLTPPIFSCLEKAKINASKVKAKNSKSTGGHTRRKLKNISHELNITDGLSEYLKTRPIYGVKIEGTWYDCGDKFGYLKANIAYARKRPDLRKKLNAFLRSF